MRAARPPVERLAALCLLAAALVACSEGPAPQTVDDLFPDPAFAACVADAARLSGPNAVIPDSGLPTVTELDCPGDSSAAGSIRSIEGAGRLTYLVDLDLYGNEVSGLSNASALEELQLGANQVTDLTPLLGVTTLINLGLNETDTTGVVGIEDLQAAGVSVNGLAG